MSSFVWSYSNRFLRRRSRTFTGNNLEEVEGNMKAGGQLLDTGIELAMAAMLILFGLYVK